MIKKMNEMNIKYTIGSDAHSISEIGYMVPEITQEISLINGKTKL